MRINGRRILAGLVAILIAVVAFWVFIWMPYERFAWLQTGTKTLEAARTPDEFIDAVGSLGAFIPLRDNGWIAIWYRDMHSGWIRSLAVARDSDGRWYESTRHFCGRLHLLHEYIRSQEDPDLQQRSDIDVIQRLGSTLEESAVYRAPDLASARAELLSLNFKEIAAPDR